MIRLLRAFAEEERGGNEALHDIDAGFKRSPGASIVGRWVIFSFGVGNMADGSRFRDGSCDPRLLQSVGGRSKPTVDGGLGLFLVLNGCASRNHRLLPNAGGPGLVGVHASVAAATVVGGAVIERIGCCGLVERADDVNRGVADTPRLGLRRINGGWADGTRWLRLFALLETCEADEGRFLRVVYLREWGSIWLGGRSRTYCGCTVLLSARARRYMRVKDAPV